MGCCPGRKGQDLEWKALQLKQSLKGRIAGGFVLTLHSKTRATNLFICGEGPGEHSPAFITENIMALNSPTPTHSLHYFPGFLLTCSLLPHWCCAILVSHILNPSISYFPWGLKGVKRDNGYEKALSSLNHFTNPSKYYRGFPGGWVGKESTLSAGNAGDEGSIPESGRFPGGGHDNPL